MNRTAAYAVCLMILVAGCDEKNAAPRAATSAIATPTNKPTSSAAPPPRLLPITFQNDEHGFALKLTHEWTIIETRDPIGNAQTDAAAKSNKAVSAALLLAAERRRGAVRTEKQQHAKSSWHAAITLSATFAAGLSTKNYIDAHLKAVGASARNDGSHRVSGRANVHIAGRLFTSVRYINGEQSRHLLFVTKSHKGALVFAFSAPSPAGLNEMARLFKTIRLE